jgi:MFS family permease
MRTPAHIRATTTTKNYIDRRWTALILLCVAEFVVVLDASIVNVALPSIGKGLHFSNQNLPWVVNAYLIAFGGFLLLGGRAADLLGRRRAFMGGLIVVAVASLLAGFATSQGELIAARAAQGLGAAILSPAALSILANLFRDGAERNKALGAWVLSPVPPGQWACSSVASSRAGSAGGGCCG